MSLDSYITLGRSGLRVSPFCLGTMTFGEDLGWGASPEDSEAMIAAYLDRGGNFIDTANVYTNGHSEKIIGDFFTKSGARRDRAVIGTKFFGSLFEGDPNGGGAGRKALITSLSDVRFSGHEDRWCSDATFADADRKYRALLNFKMN